MKESSERLLALTGGGTAGHVMPHLAMLEAYKREGWTPFYIGSKGIEKELIQSSGIEFHEVSSGKLRRYFSWENFTDVFRIILGVVQAFFVLARSRPRVVFSKGGFVSVPVALAAKLLQIPVVSHESDVTPGLANQIIAKFATQLIYSFPQTANYLPKEAKLVGVPIREELFKGDKANGAAFCGFPTGMSKPVVLIMGGSLGAQKLNQAIETAANEILEKYAVVHITGKGKRTNIVHPHYKSFEFVTKELPDLFALSDLVLARAGANSIFEFLALRKPMLLVPLEQGSRGDQVHNAANFAERGWARVLREKDLTPQTLQQNLDELRRVSPAMRAAQEQSGLHKADRQLLDLLRPFMK